MNQNPLTVLVKIKQDQLPALQELLGRIGLNIADNEYIRFSRINTTHFARFVIINGKYGPENPSRRLLFTSNIDGSWQAYIDLLIEQAGRGVEAVWSKCEGYPNLPLSDPEFNQKFKNFIAANSYKSEAFYQAYQGRTVTEIKSYIELRRQIEKLLSMEGLEPFLKAFSLLPALPPGLEARLNKITRSVKALAIKVFLRELILPFFEHLLGPSISGEAGEGYSQEVDTHPELTDWLDTVQNEMTVVSPIEPRRLFKLKLFFKVIKLAVKYNPTPGTLLGISTIHFARWVIIDDGANLLFESNYDGNWEQYIGDFVDKASGGMDAIWGSYPGYPARGSKDIQAFKKVIMDNQVRALVFFSAYPKHSVRNILNDIEISRKLARVAGQEETANLLRRL